MTGGGPDRELIIWLACDGLTYGQIAVKCAISRSCVSGIVARARKKGIDIPVSQARCSRAAPAVRRKPDSTVPVAAEPVPTGPLGDFSPRGSCQFIRGALGPQFQMCGAPGYPWCDFHKTIVYAERKSAA